MDSKIAFQLEIKLQGASHIGTGMGRGLLHRTSRRDAREEVSIPASTIKGRLRNACEDVTRLYYSEGNQLAVCRPPRPENMCRGNNLCIVCRIFGSPYAGERIFFEDAALISGHREIYDPAMQAQARTRVQLDRLRGTVKGRHLFTTEYVEPSLTFQARVEGNLPLTPFDGDTTCAYELILLAAGVRMVRQVGGDKSAGFGACEMNFVGGIQVGADTVWPTDLIEMIDCLELYEGA